MPGRSPAPARRPQRAALDPLIPAGSGVPAVPDRACDLGAHLLRPDRKDEEPRFGNLAGQRQWIEAVFDTLKDQLTLGRHGGRILAGVYARVAARLFALATAIWHTGATVKRSLLAYDH